MKSLMVTLFGVGMFLTTPALADDVEDVKAVVHEFYVLLNSTDAYDGIVHLTGGHDHPAPKPGHAHLD